MKGKGGGGGGGGGENKGRNQRKKATHDHLIPRPGIYSPSLLTHTLLAVSQSGGITAPVY